MYMRESRKWYDSKYRLNPGNIDVKREENQEKKRRSDVDGSSEVIRKSVVGL